MKSISTFGLLLITTYLWAVPVPIQDPPRPDAVAFCQHMDESQAASFCTCATAYDGTLCKSDEPLPNFCKKMCGHSRNCACCGLGKK